MKSPIKFIIYEGSKSRRVAKFLNEKHGIKLVSKKGGIGFDKQETLLIFDNQPIRKKKGSMINQGLSNKKSYPYSVAVYSIKNLKSIAEQIFSDYFQKFHENVEKWGYPWGEINKKQKDEDVLFRLENSENRLVKSFIIFLRRNNVVTLRKDVSEDLLSWLNSRENLRVFVMVCPDYSLEKKGDVLRYSKEFRLNDGIGLVAQKALNFLVQLKKFSEENNLEIHAVIGMADYEDTTETLMKLSETKSSFQRKIKESLKKINRVIKNKCLDCESILIREYFREEWDKAWEKACREVRLRLSNLDKEKVKKKVMKRMVLYSKWYPRINYQEAFEKFVMQVTEYAACGHLVSENLNSVLVLGFNSINMEEFYRLMAENLPVVYFTNVYA